MSEEMKKDMNGNETQRLDDVSRVKVLSPTMLVVKRFIRNRLALTGLAILVVMFLFSFLGTFIVPYSQTQVFHIYDDVVKDFAGVTQNDELRYTTAPGTTFPSSARTGFVTAMRTGQSIFTVDGVDYALERESDDFYRITLGREIASVLTLAGIPSFNPVAGETVSEALTAAYIAAADEGKTEFDLDGAHYIMTRQGKTTRLLKTQVMAIASKFVVDPYDQANRNALTFDFRLAAETAIARNEVAFELNGEGYTLNKEADAIDVIGQDGEPFAMITKLIVSPLASDVVITVAFKDALLAAMESGSKTFMFTENEEETEYTVETNMRGTVVRKEYHTQLIDMYARPSAEHWLGTDSNGMDVMARLMYGGQISLMVGFVVVLIELAIGVVVGGFAGYFGGVVDTLMMRFIDLFNCIPQWPVMIIFGSVMDILDVAPVLRIFLLMFILGLLGWTGIARVVRGQILSLREQDFMVATEATGLRVSRRIFKHLVPNVMPLLIVQATMSLGGIIITEATLSFLGLGLKYPMASWGTIINAATDVFVMRNFWFIWLPAGLLILITVLGFNFVGDGLRDAFDPKMKR